LSHVSSGTNHQLSKANMVIDAKMTLAFEERQYMLTLSGDWTHIVVVLNRHRVQEGRDHDLEERVRPSIRDLD
jgi:hypothetical protein